MYPEDEIDYKAVSESFQLENERLRMLLSSKHNNKISKVKFNLDINNIMLWIEGHYLFLIVAFMISYFVFNSALDFYKIRSEKNGG